MPLKKFTVVLSFVLLSGSLTSTILTSSAVALPIASNLPDTGSNQVLYSKEEIERLKAKDSFLSLGCYKFPQLSVEEDSFNQPLRHQTTTTALNAKDGGSSGTNLISQKLPPIPLSGLLDLNVDAKGSLSSATMTVLSCNLLCFKLQFLYAGLLNGSECRCGNLSLPKSLLVMDSNCTSLCSGNPSQTCGGGSTFTNLYITGYQNPTTTQVVIQDNTNNATNISQTLAIGLIIGSAFLGLLIGGSILFFLLRNRKSKVGLDNLKFSGDEKYDKFDDNYLNNKSGGFYNLPNLPIRFSKDKFTCASRNSKLHYSVASSNLTSTPSNNYNATYNYLRNKSSPYFRESRISKLSTSSILDHNLNFNSRLSKLSLRDSVDYSHRSFKVVNPDQTTDQMNGNGDADQLKSNQKGGDQSKTNENCINSGGTLDALKRISTQSNLSNYPQILRVHSRHNSPKLIESHLVDVQTLNLL